MPKRGLKRGGNGGEGEQGEDSMWTKYGLLVIFGGLVIYVILQIVLTKKLK